ncbi:MAG: sigma-70 family RNA polymerase sigma factor [Clostridia bacterium]|nr:sigma-70 family RNA polymerase sigma factor [Clostridia bacterium]
MNYEHERMIRAIVRTAMRKYEVVDIEEEDLFQEGTLALLKAEKTYKPDGGAKFETYASVVIHNRIVDIIRTYKPEKTGLTEPVGNPPDDELKELLKILHEVLDNCSEFEKAIFNAYFQGYSYQEICEIFGINKKKVDNTIQKIHRLARSIYRD